MADTPMTVVETARFLKDAKPLLSDSEREKLVVFVAASGRGAGRWPVGERVAARVIYYYHNERLPLSLLAAYGKSEKANLRKPERNAMKRLVPVLVAGYPVQR